MAISTTIQRPFTRQQNYPIPLFSVKHTESAFFSNTWKSSFSQKKSSNTEIHWQVRENITFFKVIHLDGVPSLSDITFSAALCSVYFTFTCFITSKVWIKVDKIRQLKRFIVSLRYVKSSVFLCTYADYLCCRVLCVHGISLVKGLWLLSINPSRKTFTIIRNQEVRVWLVSIGCQPLLGAAE